MKQNIIVSNDMANNLNKRFNREIQKINNTLYQKNKYVFELKPFKDTVT